MIRTIHRGLIRILEKGYPLFFGAACLVLALFCFYHLDVKYVDSWDEARHGVNAYEMLQNGNYIQHTYNYEVDTWNLKPSLSYWGILLGFRLFGCSVLGLRFYAALSYLLTGILAGLWAGRKSRAGGILVLGFFCANTLPLYAHLARAGDADSLYLLLFTIAMLAMLEWPKRRGYLYVCGLCFSLAFLTKSWHAGMIAAVGGLYLLLTGGLFKIRPAEWGKFLLSVFLPLILWFGWRYQSDGLTFLQQMVEVDLLARTGTSNFEGHSGPVSFYWDMVLGNTAYIYPWIFGVCVLGLLALLAYGIVCRRHGDRKNTSTENGGRFCLGLFLWFAVVFGGFSLMKTKLIWYCYPALVPLFLGSALLLGKAVSWEGLPGGLNDEKSPDEESRIKGGPEERSGTCGAECRGDMDSRKEACKRRFRQDQLLAAAQLLLAAGCVILVVHFMQVTLDTAIRNVHGDPFQDFLKVSAGPDCAYRDREAYIQVPGEKPEQLGDWDQNRLFLAEISGNFRCQDGGVEKFLESKDSVLYIDRENYAARQEELAGCEVLYVDEAYPYVVLGR